MRMTFNLQNLIPKFSAEEAAHLVADSGFDATDYYLGSMVEHDCVFNGDQWRDNAEQVRKVFEAVCAPVVQTHAPFSFKGWEDRSILESVIYPTIVHSIRVSAVMGAECVVVHPLHYWRYAGHEQEIFERNMQFYRSLIPVCEEYGIKVGIENMFQRDKLRGNYIIRDTCSDPTEFCRYIDTLDSPYMVACLDVGHAGLPSGNPEAWEFIRILGHDRLQAIHIHDNDYTNDQHLIPYAGTIDWSKVTQALGEIDYNGNFTFECLISKSFKNTDLSAYPAIISMIAQIGRKLMAHIDTNRPVLVKT